MNSLDELPITKTEFLILSKYPFTPKKMEMKSFFYF